MITKIQPITFEKKYKKPRTGKREIQRTQAPIQLQKMSSKEYVVELKKQADFALGEVDEIKKNANSAKIRSFEVATKAQRNKEFAVGLYAAIKENPNLSNKNFIVQYQGTTYKIENQKGKYRVIGQSRGFFGKKDVFEFEMKKGELKISVLKGYSKEKGTEAYTAHEEYHYIQNGNVKVFFDVVTDKFKKAKEEFSFNSENELSVYSKNIKTMPDDIEYGEFETSVSYWLGSKPASYTIGLNCSKNSMHDKHCWSFALNGELENYHQDCFVKTRGENDICDVKLLLGFKDNKPINGVINMHVENEKPSYEFQYEF